MSDSSARARRDAAALVPVPGRRLSQLYDPEGNPIEPWEPHAT